jgi:DNA modification methylase
MTETLTTGYTVFKGQEIHEKLEGILAQDLDFNGKVTNYASHNFHSFPAKFPPQIPNKFICELTNPGDTVLDPMVGSGTTILEAYLLNRRSIGLDIDPLALLISKVKTTPLNYWKIRFLGEQICERANKWLENNWNNLEIENKETWDLPTRKFVDYWFSTRTQLELFALIKQINTISEHDIKDFFTLAFSSIIITKSGGVSLALDLGHTRPHKAKIINYMIKENVSEYLSSDEVKKYTATKIVRSAIEEFRKRVQKNLAGLPEENSNRYNPILTSGNAQRLGIKSNSVDLIVTSPPYPSNAIDYMRAHKFSLVWLGHNIEDLSKKRKEYIGGEVVFKNELEQLPYHTSSIVNKITNIDAKKGLALYRYYSEMFRALREMHRVLKPGHVAIVVVGSSIVRSISTETGICLAEIGKTVGFDVPKIAIRNIERDRRMMPVAGILNTESQIQKRMHEENVIGFVKK